MKFDAEKFKALCKKDIFERARKYMSHTQKCNFKFGTCDCGYTDFIKDIKK